MAQERILFNNKAIKQPDKGLSFNWETTYSSDSGRVQSGVNRFNSLFTVESFSYTATNLTPKEVSEILKIIARGRRFTMHYFSPYHGKWRDDKFYVGQGSVSIGKLKENEEVIDSISFNIIGINPLKEV